MAWEIVASALGASGITAIAALGNVWLANRRAEDDERRDIRRESSRRLSELRQEELKSLKQTLGQVTAIVDRYSIARQRGDLLGDPSAAKEAGEAAKALVAHREETGPHPWWTVPDTKLEKLCQEFYRDVGNLELLLVSTLYLMMTLEADVLSAKLFLTRSAIATRMEELISGLELADSAKNEETPAS